jgi:hypothetical protein
MLQTFVNKRTVAAAPFGFLMYCKVPRGSCIAAAGAAEWGSYLLTDRQVPVADRSH